MKRAASIGLVVILGGCANHPLDCATGLVAWDDCLPGTKGYEIRQRGLANKQYALETKAAVDDAKCKSYGASPGSDAYVACRVELDKGH